MLIDWFTVGAQALNFIILVWLMKRFLYQPILNAIDTREKKIADQLARAEKTSQDAAEEKSRFEQKNVDFDQQREKLMEEATQAATRERQVLLEEAHKTQEALAASQNKAMQEQMFELHSSIRQSMQKELVTTAGKVLRDLADTDIESRMVAVFINKLHELGDDKVNVLRGSKSDSQINVKSSSPLSQDQQKAISSELGSILNTDVSLKFFESPDLIGGIELTANGFKIGWSVSEYLNTLDDALSNLVGDPAKAASVNEKPPVAEDRASKKSQPDTATQWADTSSNNSASPEK